MTIGKIATPRPFKPTLKGGGSLPGKPWDLWPFVLKVVADAIYCAAKGSEEAWADDRKYRISNREFGLKMDRLCPGWQQFMTDTRPPRKTSWIHLLNNRVYKMHYSGTSDRGTKHNPLTRACQSKEHWRKYIPVGSPLRDLHARVVAGNIEVINDWRSYLI